MNPARESHLMFAALRHCKNEIEIPELDIRVRRFKMESKNGYLQHGGKPCCPIHGYEFPVSASRFHHETNQLADALIPENLSFAYFMVTSRPIPAKPARGVILLFHGLNEKSWQKYLPWALRLHRGTGKPVILFPLAFHMDRAPAEWIEPRSMQVLSRERAARHPAIHAHSLANAAISERLEADPRRFAWSGLQSLYDLFDLCRRIRAGLHPGILPNPRIDLFAYSIGAFLALIAIMTNPGNIYSTSRLFCFCGGCVLNRTNPTSRYIMDSEATIALYAMYVEYLETEIRTNPRLAHFISSMHPEGMFFRSLLDLNQMAEFRDLRLHQLRSRIRALVLKRDLVIPPLEVIYTLQGRHRKIPIRIRQTDFPYPYTHENPFPLQSSHSGQVTRMMDRTMAGASRFLSH
ncbi:MAG TPA: hypothetical protein ENN40_09735 [Candidatus Aminicenantes bacterium]|nr:hypothetical protein [Candidatus Aminicenantes bacterium]